MGYPYEKIKDIKRNAEFTAEARAALNGRWLNAIGATSGILWALGILQIIAGAVLLVVLNSMLSDGGDFVWLAVLPIMGVFSIFVGVLNMCQNFFSMALIHWGLNVLDRRENTIIKSFAVTLRLYGKLFLAGLLITLIVIGKGLLLIVPGILAALDYSQTIPCLMDDPELGVREALRRSRAITYGHRWQLVLLGMRFWGWGILCILTLGIGFLWLWPYALISCMAFYRSCMPLPETEEYAKLPPVKKQSCVNNVLHWIIVIVALLSFILGAFADAANTAEKIIDRVSGTTTVQR